MSHRLAAADVSGEELPRALGITVSSIPAPLGLPAALETMPLGHTSWLVTLKRRGAPKLTVPWYQYPVVVGAPSPSQVIARLVDSVHAARVTESAEAWSELHGLDSDDSEAHKTYFWLLSLVDPVWEMLGDDGVQAALAYAELHAPTGVVAPET